MDDNRAEVDNLDGHAGGSEQNWPACMDCELSSKPLLVARLVHTGVYADTVSQQLIRSTYDRCRARCECGIVREDEGRIIGRCCWWWHFAVFGGTFRDDSGGRHGTAPRKKRKKRGGKAGGTYNNLGSAHEQEKTLVYAFTQALWCVYAKWNGEDCKWEENRDERRRSRRRSVGWSGNHTEKAEEARKTWCILRLPIRQWKEARIIKARWISGWQISAGYSTHNGECSKVRVPVKCSRWKWSGIGQGVILKDHFLYFRHLSEILFDPQYYLRIYVAACIRMKFLCTSMVRLTA